jgi:hypothetical protein
MEKQEQLISKYTNKWVNKWGGDNIGGYCMRVFMQRCI